MPNIYAIGETVYDIIFRNEQPAAAKAGGSMLNTAVSLGRLGLPIRFISEYGTDQAGDIIEEFLLKNAVHTGYNYRYSDGKTAIALAFLNDRNDASYSFYKQYPEKRLEIELPGFSGEDIVLFGAFYSLMPEVRRQLITFVRAAKDAGALILYDPNIRHPHKDEMNSLKELIFENLSLSTLVRASDEDFRTMFDAGSAEEAYSIVKAHGCDTLIYTRNSRFVDLLTADGRLEIPVPQVKTVSTIGAGDSFNAGLIYAMIREGFTHGNIKNMEMASWKRILETAISFGSHVCTHYDNYISESFVKSLV
ncbi:MAG: carbohydrate kinase [Bacteroidales bacterium]|nr:carbohydrate kinase [Bacteroidales bacterium]